MMYWSYGSAWGNPAAPPADADPRQILMERLARGEIKETEYRARLAALRGDGLTHAP